MQFFLIAHSHSVLSFCSHITRGSLRCFPMDIMDTSVSMNKMRMLKHGSPDQSEWRTKADVRNLGEIQPLEKRETHQSLKNSGSACVKKCFSLQQLKQRLPILVWLPSYSVNDLKGDLVAGTTVALTVIPQGLALAMLAGLPPQYGLYTAFMGCFMYTIFGSCKDLTIGPTSIMSLMTAEHVATGGVVYCVLLTFLSGCIMLTMGLLNLGFLITFISSPVVTGFTTAAAITIATTQLSGIFGLKYKSEGFINDIVHFFRGIINGEILYWDMTMGICGIVFLLFFRHFRTLKVGCCSRQPAKVFESLWWILVMARFALLVLICTGIAFGLMSNSINVLTLTQEVKPGLPSFKFPQFSYTNSTGNDTIYKDFGEIVQDIGSGLAIIPLLGILEAIAIAKAFAKGKSIDATQEMIALGICNIMGSFVQSYPATGSFSRTALNFNSGVKTPAGGIVTGSLVLLALGVMSSSFHYIPKASLSALIFVAVLNMVHYQDIGVMWKTNKLDLLPFFGTLVFSFVLGLEYGILVGIGISLCLLLFQEARPNVTVEERKTFLGNPYFYVLPDRSVFFPSAEYLQTKVLKLLPDVPSESVFAVVMDGCHLMNADYTMAMVCKGLASSMEQKNTSLIFTNFKISVLNAIKGAFTSDDKFNSALAIDDAESLIDALYISNKVPVTLS